MSTYSNHCVLWLQSYQGESEQPRYVQKGLKVLDSDMLFSFFLFSCFGDRVKLKGASLNLLSHTEFDISVCTCVDVDPPCFKTGSLSLLLHIFVCLTSVAP